MKWQNEYIPIPEDSTKEHYDDVLTRQLNVKYGYSVTHKEKIIHIDETFRGLMRGRNEQDWYHIDPSLPGLKVVVDTPWYRLYEILILWRKNEAMTFPLFQHMLQSFPIQHQTTQNSLMDFSLIHPSYFPLASHWHWYLRIITRTNHMIQMIQWTNDHDEHYFAQLVDTIQYVMRSKTSNHKNFVVGFFKDNSNDLTSNLVVIDSFMHTIDIYASPQCCTFLQSNDLDLKVLTPISYHPIGPELSLDSVCFRTILHCDHLTHFEGDITLEGMRDHRFDRLSKLYNKYYDYKNCVIDGRDVLDFYDHDQRDNYSIGQCIEDQIYGALSLGLNRDEMAMYIANLLGRQRKIETIVEFFKYRRNKRYFESNTQNAYIQWSPHDAISYIHSVCDWVR
jgi:hypothetical protein